MIIEHLSLIEEPPSTVAKVWDWAFFKKQMEKRERPLSSGKSRRHLTRAPNACIPCRKSKTRCDHAVPSCTNCKKRRDQSSDNKCVYATPRVGRRAISPATGVSRPLRSQISNADHPQSESDPSADDTNDDSDTSTEQQPHRGPPCVVEDEKMFGIHSMARFVDQFKDLSAGKDPSVNSSCVFQHSAREAFETTETLPISATATEDEEDFVSKTAQLNSFSLPQTFIDSLQPYLRTLYKEALRVQKMIHMGRLMQAWIEMPRLVRLAQLDRLDHNQGSMTPPPEPDEKESRLRVWWFILDLDINISMHIGRPLAVRAKLGIDRPTLSDIEGVYKELEQSRLDFKQYALEVVSEICIEDELGDSSVNQQIGEIIKLDRLQGIEKRLPQIPDDHEFDAQLTIAVADHKLELLAFKMMVCCGLAKANQKQQKAYSKLVLQKNGPLDQVKPGAKKVGRPRRVQRHESYDLILLSARSILEIFDILMKIDSHRLQPNWNRFFDAYCAAAILGIASLQQVHHLSSDVALVYRASNTFASFARKHCDCHVAGVAAFRIGDLMEQLHKFSHAQSTETQSSKDSSTYRNVQKRGRTKNENTTPKKRKSGDLDETLEASNKRPRRDTESPTSKQSETEEPYNSAFLMYGQDQISTTGFSRSGFAMDPVLEEPQPVVGYTPADPHMSAPLSFNSSMSATDPSTHLPYNEQVYANLGIQRGWFHPPMAQPDVPLLNWEQWGLPPSTMAFDSREGHRALGDLQGNQTPNQMTTQDLAALQTGAFQYSEYVPHHSAASVSQSPYHNDGTVQYFPSQQGSMAWMSEENGSERRQRHHAPDQACTWDHQQQAHLFPPHSTPVEPSAGYYTTFHVPTTTAAWG